MLRLEPAEGFEFVNKIVGGVIPREYIPAVEAGVKQALEEGVIKGYPVVNVKATLLDGSYHEVDSSELAFKNAGMLAARECLKMAGPQLLEPIMKLEITSPEEFTGNIINNISNRRGKLESMEMENSTRLSKDGPLQSCLLFKFFASTQGRADFPWSFPHYEQRPTDHKYK